MRPKYMPDVHTGSHLFEPGQILCNKYATPYSVTDYMPQYYPECFI